jgi:hypothetical protein
MITNIPDIIQTLLFTTRRRRIAFISVRTGRRRILRIVEGKLLRQDITIGDGQVALDPSSKEESA